MAQTPSIPKGTRDFGCVEMARRNYIFDNIKEVFRRFGYQQIETPAMENLSTLMGKYGEEGDKLLYRILNSGDAFAGIDLASAPSSAALSSKVCEKGLRYDLTVPFARFVTQHQNDISFPFKRFQIQPVWRADRPQKGRYREFYQCDADVIGSTSLLNELELVQMVDMVFARLGINVCIKINNRKLLAGIAEVAGVPERMMDITVAIDKIDKIGLDAVKAELLEKEVPEAAIAVIEPVLTLSGSNSDKIEFMRNMLAASEVGMKGVEEISTLFGLIAGGGISQKVEFDLSLARGLNYYTGAIFEVKALDFAIGSICGGGRYDDLTGIFGLKNVSGVGISFGADRIYDVLLGLDKYPAMLSSGVSVLFANMGQAEAQYCLPALAELRSHGYSCALYPESAKLKKQFEYANRGNVQVMIIAGESEMERGMFNVKNMATGEQTEVAREDLFHYMTSILDR